MPKMSQLGISHWSFAISLIWRNPDILLPAPLASDSSGMKQCVHRDTCSYINYTERVYCQSRRFPSSITQIPRSIKSLRCPSPCKDIRQLNISSYFFLRLITADFKGHFYSIICKKSLCRPPKQSFSKERSTCL